MGKETQTKSYPLLDYPGFLHTRALGKVTDLPVVFADFTIVKYTFTDLSIVKFTTYPLLNLFTDLHVPVVKFTDLTTVQLKDLLHPLLILQTYQFVKFTH